MSAHLKDISRKGGLFEDTTVTGSRWQGQIRRVRVVLYRRLKSNGKRPSAIEVEEALNDVAVKWMASLASAGVKAHRATGKAFYEWMLCWFNPNPEMVKGDTAKLLELAPYPGDDNLPFGYDFAEQLTLSLPRSDQATSSWLFDNIPHTRGHHSGFTVALRILATSPQNDRRMIRCFRSLIVCRNIPSWR